MDLKNRLIENLLEVLISVDSGKRSKKEIKVFLFFLSLAKKVDEGMIDMIDMIFQITRDYLMKGDKVKISESNISPQLSQYLKKLGIVELEKHLYYSASLDKLPGINEDSIKEIKEVLLDICIDLADSPTKKSTTKKIKPTFTGSNFVPVKGERLL